MLECKPKDELSKNYHVFRKGEVLVAEVDFNDPEETGAIRIGDKAYSIANDKSWRAGERKLFAGDALRASSLKPSMLKWTFAIEAPEMKFEMTRTGFLVKKYELRRGEELLGDIGRTSVLTRVVQISVDDKVPLHLQLFSFWLVLMQWHWAAGS